MAPTKINKIKSQPPATVQNFPIVGIGASAGGLDAFKRLLKAIPENSGMAYVLVQHLDPTHESFLPEILQRVTKIPVHEITEDIHLAPDHIYIIPSNKILTSTDGVLQLTPREKKILNLSIDVFFASLADVHKEFAVGVVLSGTGSDGTKGLKAIKEQGGITIAQDIESAAYDAMPQNAIDAGVVDFILPPEKIPQQLLQINSIDKTIVAQTVEKAIPKDDEIIFKQILTIIRQNSGVDFTYYKQPTPRRRIARRMAICKTLKLSGYLKFLRTNKAEQDALFHDMLIPVTSFFRDPKTFHELSTTIIPMLLKNKSADEPIRVWIAGCSTGEEAYSIAICLHEYCTEKLIPTRIQIFASDISEVAIKKARTGTYTKADVETLTDARLKTYFIKSNGSYEVSKLIRDMCVFAPHNFLKDPPFAKIDLISCRNSLIYMNTFLQKKALTTFHYALREKGFLLLGKSETTGASSDLFASVSKHEKFYSRKSMPGRFMHVATERKEESLAIKDIKPLKPEGTQTDFRKSGEAMLLAEFTPAGVIVNEQSDIVHIHGAMSPFLEQSPGKPTFNLLKMAHEGLAFELRNALHKAKTSNKIFAKENIPVRLKNKQSLVTIQVIPLVNTVEPHYFVLFSKSVSPTALPTEGKSKSTPAIQKVKKDAASRIQQVENELAQTREDMRSITEDQEAANEELQSANEELLSSSEEMQSLNEELETSKEELQSTNEELTIINQELLDKQEQLNASHFYSEAIVTTMREPLIVLDKALRIKIANASFYKKFNVEETEIENKLFYEIQNHQFDDHLLRSLLEKILPQKNSIEDFEIKFNFPDKSERIILLNARQIINEKKSEQLILLALEDITDRVHSEKILKESEAKFRTLSETIPNMIWAATPDGQKNFFNQYFLDYTGLSFEELKGDGMREIIFPADLEKDLQLWQHSLKTGEDFRMDKRIRHHDGTYRWHISHGSAQKDMQGNITGWIGSNTEIEERKKFTDQLEAKVKERTTELQISNEELKQTNMQLQQFAHVASHDLQEPLRKILTFSMILQNKHTDGLSTEVRSYLNKIEGSSKRMTTLIQDLLNYSRLLQHEKLFSPTDLNETIKNIVNDFELLIQEKKAEINFSQLPTIEAIPLQMNQLFYNLIGNALKFSRTNVVPMISVSSRTLSEEEIKKYPALPQNLPLERRGAVEIIFKDNGIGFDQHYDKKIFTIFQRLHNQETYSGTGIGLALSKKITENHHGEIFTDAKENEGAEFHVILPIAQS